MKAVVGLSLDVSNSWILCVVCVVEECTEDNFRKTCQEKRLVGLF